VPIGRGLGAIYRFCFQGPSLTLEDWTDRLSRNVDKYLSTLHNTPEDRRSQNSSTQWSNYVSCSTQSVVHFQNTTVVFLINIGLKPAFLKCHVLTWKYTLWFSNIRVIFSRYDKKKWAKQCANFIVSVTDIAKETKYLHLLGRNNNLWQKRVDWHIYLRRCVYS
jgi:hypothetical protein